MGFTLGFGNPDPDLSGVVSPAWVHLRRSTVVSEVSTVFKLGRMVRFSTATRLCSSHILLMQTLEVSPGCGTSGHCHYYCAGQSHSKTKNIVAIWTLAGEGEVFGKEVVSRSRKDFAGF